MDLHRRFKMCVNGSKIKLENDKPFFLQNSWLTVTVVVRLSLQQCSPTLSLSL